VIVRSGKDIEQFNAPSTLELASTNRCTSSSHYSHVVSSGKV